MYMVRFCPHDLFVNTKSDLGVCPKIHDPKLKESFEKSMRHDQYVPKFEAELAYFCEKLVSDLDKKVRRGRERLDQEMEPPPALPISAEKSEQLSVLEEKIKNLLEQVETLGEAGKVDEAEALMRKVDVLNIEKSILMKPLNDKLMQAQEKKMALCDICGSFLIANDAAERTVSHVIGKQHIGYGMVRDFLAEYKAEKDKAKEEQRSIREKEAEERRKQKDENEKRGRVDSSYKERERYRDQDRERDRSGRERRDREMSHERNGRGSSRGQDWKHNNNYRDGGRDRRRDRDRHRSRSHSPVSRGNRNSSKSPVRQL
ncbi:luc7-like protein 3 isoform X2 [Impatiens glandulifera]|nr:luc7-like protein 3 isoform X2 [Impatiens glandulifera]